MRTAHWKIFTDATSKPKAVKVYLELRQHLENEMGGCKVDPWHKGGFTVTFETEVSEAEWNDGVVNVLAQAQRVGRQWVVTGDITEELDGWSNDPTVPGVTALHVIMEA